MIQVTLRLKNQENFLSEIAKKLSVTIKKKECNSNMLGSGCTQLVEILGVDEKLPELEKELKENPFIVISDLVLTGKGCVLGILKTNKYGTCALTHNYDVFLLSTTIEKNGDEEWKLLSLNEKGILDMLAGMKKKGIDVELVSKVHVDMDSLLTARQEKIIQVAYKRGYFDYPKRINIREIARIFEISISTISEILRKGEKKIIGKYFEDV